MSLVAVNHLYRVSRLQVVWPNHGQVMTVDPDQVLWFHASRKSSIGGYIGTFSLAYLNMGWHPNGNLFQLSMDCVQEIEDL